MRRRTARELAPGTSPSMANTPAVSNIAVGAPSQSPALIHPGEIWPDNRGQHIQAHGGGVIQVGDTWYWFGEDRENQTTVTKPNERYVSCYASRDLIHWEFRNKVVGGLPPEPELKAPYVFERPKVFPNKKTGKFVMYIHLDDSSYKLARVGVYVSDKVDGNYKFVRSFRPLEKESRDIGQFIDDDGSAYLIFECRPTKSFFIAKLSADYLDVEKSVCFMEQYLQIRRENHPAGSDLVLRCDVASRERSVSKRLCQLSVLFLLSLLPKNELYNESRKIPHWHRGSLCYLCEV